MKDRAKKNNAFLQHLFQTGCVKLEGKKEVGKIRCSYCPVGFSFPELSSAKVGWSISLVLILGFPSFA
jgi:hypothetical protein